MLYFLTGALTTDGIESRPMRKDIPKSKVNEHDFAAVGDEDVSRFDIPVNHEPGVAMRDCAGEIAGDLARFVFREFALALVSEMLF